MTPPSRPPRRPLLKRPIVPDMEVWERVTKSITPLVQTASAKGVAKGVPPAEPAVCSDAAPAELTPEYPASGRPTLKRVPHPLTAPSRHHNAHTSEIDKRLRRRFRQGRLPIEGKLDLHGHTRTSAHSLLRTFLHDAYYHGKRCMLVITGKGMRSERDFHENGYGKGIYGGVLYQAVPEWLQASDLGHIVLAHTRATPADGGDGALYVLLKRKR